VCGLSLLSLPPITRPMGADVTMITEMITEIDFNWGAHVAVPRNLAPDARPIKRLVLTVPVADNNAPSALASPASRLCPSAILHHLLTRGRELKLSVPVSFHRMLLVSNENCVGNAMLALSPKGSNS
jgi:hypothetical protein